MAMGVCVHCGSPVGNTARPCPACGAPEPVPEKPIQRCTTCNGVLKEGGQGSCHHCGAPSPLAPFVPGRLGRCGKCGHAISREAGQCVRCKTSRQAERIQVTDKSATCPNCGGSMAANRKLCVPCTDDAMPVPGRSTRVKCPTCGADLANLSVRCLRCNPLPVQDKTPLTEDLRLATQRLDKTPLPVARVDCTPLPVGIREDDRASQTGHCLVCNRVVPLDSRPCPVCGVSNPFNLKPAPRAVAPPRALAHGRSWLAGAVVVLGALSVVALLLVGRPTAESKRVRIREAFGDQATEENVAALEHEAEALEVSPDALIKVRLLCHRRESRRPTTPEFRAARDLAARQGKSPEDAVLALARAACQ